MNPDPIRWVRGRAVWKKTAPPPGQRPVGSRGRPRPPAVVPRLFDNSVVSHASKTTKQW